MGDAGKPGYGAVMWQAVRFWWRHFRDPRSHAEAARILEHYRTNDPAIVRAKLIADVLANEKWPPPRKP